jgi:uncharacterized protein YbjT (DUF2867 family)
LEYAAWQDLIEGQRVAKLYTVFGGSGFLGRYVVQALAKSGARIRVATRDPHLSAHVRPLAALGQLDFVRADLTVPASVVRAVEGSDGVINLVGVLKDSSRGGFDGLHVKGASAIAAAAVQSGVGALVHVSAIGADPASASAYGRSKGEGEAAVRAANPSATILRPSIVFGPEDNFLNRFAAMIRMAPIVPVIAPNVKFQPVYVVDIAHAIVAAVTDPAAHGGKSYSLGGPNVLSMKQLLVWIAEVSGRTPDFIDVPDGIASLLARLTGWLPGAPITSDQWLMLQADNIVPPGAAGLEALGIDPTPMAAIAPSWLVRFRPSGRFSAA